MKLKKILEETNRILDEIGAVSDDLIDASDARIKQLEQENDDMRRHNMALSRIRTAATEHGELEAYLNGQKSMGPRIEKLEQENQRLLNKVVMLVDENRKEREEGERLRVRMRGIASRAPVVIDEPSPDIQFEHDHRVPHDYQILYRNAITMYNQLAVLIDDYSETSLPHEERVAWLEDVIAHLPTR